MSVDYSSVLIYGFQIPLTNENCAAMFRATGGKEFWECSKPNTYIIGATKPMYMRCVWCEDGQKDTQGREELW